MNLIRYVEEEVMFNWLKKESIDITLLEDEENDPKYYVEDYYSIQYIKQLLQEAKRFSTCDDSQNVYEPIITKIISSIQWLLSFDYVYKCEKEETKRYRSERKIFKIIIKHGTQNCMEACMYIDEILEQIKQQPISLLMQTNIRIKIIETIKEMMRTNQTLYFMDQDAQIVYLDFLKRLIDETEDNIFKIGIRTKEKIDRMDKIKELILLVDSENVFDKSYTKSEWKEYCNKKLGRYEGMNDVLFSIDD